ncbi:glycosyltransferase family 4 protein, partial [Candidatus Woesearchaeota archaeon]|nr:glycosyltransferase family 4 protein [Candidatus Woesearchaeota archaeon]
MKVLMLGWEFPPYKSGGLGTACYGLTKGLAQEGADVTFIMPHAPDEVKADFVTIIGTKGKRIRLRGVKSPLTPYQTANGYKATLRSMEIFKKPGMKQVYGRDLYEEVQRFTYATRKIAEEEPHDVIHAHDWMTYHAGMEARNVSGKPFVAHIHATEFDRTGGNPNQYISHIEYTGLKAADCIIANSEYTKQNIIKHYKIDPEKIKVVYFGIDPDVPYYNLNFRSALNKQDKIVLFLGRVTLQKGPDYFIEAAANVLRYKKNVRFIVAGSGDMLPRVNNKAAELGIADRVTFTGFLDGEEVHKAFQMADVYVMPSVS